MERHPVLRLNAIPNITQFGSLIVPIGGSGAVPPMKVTNRCMRSSVSRPPNASDHCARPRQQHFLVRLSVFIALLDIGSLALKLRSRVLGAPHALKPAGVCDQVLKVLSEALEALPRVQHQLPWADARNLLKL